MNETVETERSLVIAFRDARAKCEAVEKQFAEAKAERDNVEAKLIEMLINEDKKSTGRYEGVGFCTLVKPRLYARFDKENEERVFSYLRESGRDEMIKPTVNTQSLSTYVGELLDEGKQPPEFISFYMKQTVRYTPS